MQRYTLAKMKSSFENADIWRLVVMTLDESEVLHASEWRDRREAKHYVHEFFPNARSDMALMYLPQ